MSVEALVYRLLAPHDLRLDRESLSSPGPGMIQARTLYTVLSPGTELAAWRGDPPLRPGLAYPRLVGYCSVAEIEAVGDGVAACAGQRILTFQSHRSAFVCPAAEILAVLPVGIDPCEAAATYLFHLGYSTLVRGSVLAGSRVAVVGMGCLGLASVAMAHRAGAVVDGYSDVVAREASAMRCGATHVIRKQAVDSVEGAYDVVINTSSGWEDWFLSLRLARKGGTVCVLGFPGRTEGKPATNPLDSRWFYDKQLALIACGQLAESDVPPWENRFTVKRNCAYLLDQLARGALPAGELITRRVAFDQLEGIYRALEAREPDLVSAALEWSAC
ncbi:MAG TPA: zinc-binding alcohol dehydrogenase [Kiritimatiellia bacterium]|nr:zinc-binding alcohol dehydrogenase [Kiritimatiellia bacterium]